MNIVIQQVKEIEVQIKALNVQRNDLLKRSHVTDAEVAQILAFRTPKRTLCQMLRELHDRADESDQQEIERCLLIAKKMDMRLRQYAGAEYSNSWYDAAGNFIR